MNSATVPANSTARKAWRWTDRDNILVADTGNHRVQVFNLFGSFQTAFGSQGSADSQFQSPQGIAFDGMSIFVADTGNTFIKRLENISGTFQASFGSPGSGDGQFASPTGVAIDTSGKLYVADRNNHRVQVFSTTGTFQYTFGTQGSLDGQYPRTVVGGGQAITHELSWLITVTTACSVRPRPRDSSAWVIRSSGNRAATTAQEHDVNSTGVFVSRGYNLVGVASGPSTGFTNSVNNDLVGTACR